MNQVIIKKGKAIIENVPAPTISDNAVLVKVMYSCISAGTELVGVKSSKETLIQKALKQPEKVKRAIDIAMSDGIYSTYTKVKGQLESGNATGYSASGVVVEVGASIKDIKVGDRVACAGAKIANHAEYILVPRNLVVKMPDNLGFDKASTVTLGSIALQGVRRLDSRLGEYVAVIGLGILGQLTVQLLALSGCKVIGIDLDDRRIELAKTKGLMMGLNPKTSDCVKEIGNFTNGYGVDGVIIATATSSSDPLSQAFNMCRKKGRVVLVGTVGMEINREDMYKKELDLYISTSYGPGRYDEAYEEKGHDYPYGYVRWTENRNMEAYLELLYREELKLDGIIEKVYSVEEAETAFEVFNSDIKPLMVLLKYNEEKEENIKKRMDMKTISGKNRDIVNVAIIGAGNFAKGKHIPNLLKMKEKYNIYAVMSRTGYNAKALAEQCGAVYATTDYDEVLNDSNVDLVMICTRHNLHAPMAVKALKAGKAVFVEKPMATNRQELDELIEVIEQTKLPFMVGFNRRFSNYAVEAKRHIENRINPLIINYQMNAGYIPLDNWVHGQEGGGRIIGEGCHIIDLFNYLTGSEIDSIHCESIDPKTASISSNDNAAIILKYKDGSVCNLVYTAIGSRDCSKELCQIYFDGKIIIIDDYKRIVGHGVKVKNIATKNPEKGQYEELIELYSMIKGDKGYIIPVESLSQTTLATFIIDEQCSHRDI